jgi:hypothetical protein
MNFELQVCWGRLGCCAWVCGHRLLHPVPLLHLLLMSYVLQYNAQ